MVISPAALQDALHWRYATKVFDPGRSIPAETWTALEQSLVLSPSSYGLQPWKFVLIRNPELRQQLRPHSWDQSQITDCCELVVFAGRRDIEQADLDRLIEATCQSRGLAPEQLGFYADLMRRNLVGARAAASQCHRRMGGPAGLHRPGHLHDRRSAAGDRHLPD